jgi:hypothetical protein
MQKIAIINYMYALLSSDPSYAMNIVDPDIVEPDPTAIHEYSEGADIRNHRSLFAGLTVMVNVTLPSGLLLSGI